MTDVSDERLETLRLAGPFMAQPDIVRGLREEFGAHVAIALCEGETPAREVFDELKAQSDVGGVIVVRIGDRLEPLTALRKPRGSHEVVTRRFASTDEHTMGEMIDMMDADERRMNLSSNLPPHRPGEGLSRAFGASFDEYGLTALQPA